MPVIEGTAPWHINFTLSCVISLWDSAPAHSPSGEEFNPSSQEYVLFSGRTSRHNVFILSCVGTLWFGTHPYFSLVKDIYYLKYWSISIERDHCYLKYVILYVVYFYRERPLLSENVTLYVVYFSMWGADQWLVSIWNATLCWNWLIQVLSLWKKTRI